MANQVVQNPTQEQKTSSPGGFFTYLYYIVALALCVYATAFSLTLGIGSWLVFTALTFYRGIQIIQPAEFGIVTRFGGRLPGFLKERRFPHFIVPFIDQVDIYDYKVDTDEVKVDFFTRDRVEISFIGSLQKRPSPYISDQQGRVRFVEMNPETIVRGIVDGVKSILGKIAGVELVDRFIRDRRALELLMNCEFRMETPPHRNRELVLAFIEAQRTTLAARKFQVPEEQKTEIERQVKQLNDVSEEARKSELVELPPEFWIDFYASNIRELEKRLKDAQKQEENSEIETRYGIEIITLLIADIDFSSETKKALERERQAEADLQGARRMTDLLNTLVKEQREQFPDLSDQELLQRVEVYLKLREAPKVFGLTTESNEILRGLLQRIIVPPSAEKRR